MKYKPFFLFLISIAILGPGLNASPDDSGLDNFPLSALCSPIPSRPLSEQFPLASSPQYEALLMAAREEFMKHKQSPKPRRSFSLSDYGNFSAESSLVSSPRNMSPVPQVGPNTREHIPLLPFPPHDKDTPLSPSRALLSPLKKLSFDFEGMLPNSMELTPQNESRVPFSNTEFQSHAAEALSPPAQKYSTAYQGQLDFQKTWYDNPEVFSWHPRDGHMMF